MMTAETQPSLPVVPLWRVNLLRLMFLVLVVAMGSMVWNQLLFQSADWPLHTGVAKSMLAALALLSVLGLRYPLQMLPLMLFEVAWKVVWLTLIAARAWLGHRWTPQIAGLFNECIGIVVVIALLPWRYIWARYVTHPNEPLRP